MECWERLLGKGCFVHLTLKKQIREERKMATEGTTVGGGRRREWENVTHSQSGSSPQTHPSPPGAAPWPSHSGQWGWLGSQQRGSWPTRWAVGLSSLEGRRHGGGWAVEGLRVLESLRLPAGLLPGNLERAAKCPHSLTAPLLAISLSFHVLFLNTFFFFLVSCLVFYSQFKINRAGACQIDMWAGLKGYPLAKSGITFLR